MERVLELTAKMLRTGEARSKHHDDGPAWQTAIGLNPFLSDDAYRFLLATTKAPTRIGTSEFTDIPIAFARDPRPVSAATGYFLGKDGRFYSLVAGASTPNVIRPQNTLTALSNAVGGMIGLYDSGANPYLFLCTNNTLLRWDLDTSDDASHWNDSNGLVSHFRHPMHRLFDSVYFGNGYYLGRIPLDKAHNQSTTLSNVEFQSVNFGNSHEMVDALGDDGRYLIVATSIVTTSNGDVNDAWLRWYSGIGPNWEWEVRVPGERNIRAIVRNALGTFAIGEQSAYQIAFGETPRLVRTFDIEDSIADANGDGYSSFAGSRVNQAAPFGDSMMFGKRGAVFGKRSPTEPVTFSHPLQGHTDDISLIVPNFEKGKILVGTEDSKLWRYDLSQAGNTSNTYPSRWFDLKGDFNLTRVEIELPAQIAADDVTTITFEVPPGQTASVTLSQATVRSLDRYYAKLAIKPKLRGSKVKITVAQSAGAPRMGGIYLYGEPVTQ